MIPYLSVDAAWNLSRSIHHIQDVNDIYRDCDYITIHVPLTDSTKGMISREAIEMMKEGVGYPELLPGTLWLMRRLWWKL